jgi:hypothetical protein
MIGVIYKNRRTHPERVFVVTSVKKVRKGGQKMLRLNGLYIADNVPPVESSFLEPELNEKFGFVMWAPAND